MRVVAAVAAITALALGVLATGGCAQLVGIDKTTGGVPPDGPTADAPAADAPPDGPRACVGGDARVTNPATGSCYVLFTTPMTWDAARATCATLGAGTALARVESAAENELVTTLIGDATVYIGATDLAVEGTFVWEDGSPLVYTNWNLGEPNNGTGLYEEDCAVIHGSLAGTWDDRPCAPPPIESGAAAFVCEHGG